MNPENIIAQSRPILKTKREVFKSAHENRMFFNSFKESLSNSWSFYKS